MDKIEYTMNYINKALLDFVVFSLSHIYKYDYYGLEYFMVYDTKSISLHIFRRGAIDSNGCNALLGDSSPVNR